jgi:hypothetical protein
MDSMLSFTWSGLMSSFLFGVVGMWLFGRGKSQSNFHWIFIGIALMIYPYFTNGPWMDWGVGFALCGLAHHFQN